MDKPITTFADIFEEPVKVTITIEPATDNARSLDPLAELRSKPKVQIFYKRKIKNNQKNAFMEINKRHLNWLKLLLEELKWTDIPSERTVLLRTAPVKRGIGRGARTQMWEDFVGEMYTNKAVTRDDYSEGQLRHLPELIAELAKVSLRFKGAGDLQFVDVDTGEVLV